MGKAGPILGILGGLMMLLGGVWAIMQMNSLEAQLQSIGTSFSELGIDVSLFYINFAMTALWGAIAIIGSILTMKEVKAGGFIVLLAGIMAIAGMFIPLGTWTIDIAGYAAYTYTISLSSSLIFIDPFLILIGGLLCLKSDD